MLKKLIKIIRIGSENDLGEKKAGDVFKVKSIRSRYEGDLRVIEYESYLVHGIIFGEATILKGGFLVVWGGVNGNIFIGDGGHCVVYGAINGDVTNHGRFEHFGIHNGELFNRESISDKKGSASVNNGSIQK